jgi:hypothetical protein
MERLAWWLEGAREQNAWQQAEDAVQVAMLHGMLEHLRKEIDAFIAQGGDEVQETVHAFRAVVTETTS